MNKLKTFFLACLMLLAVAPILNQKEICNAMEIPNDCVSPYGEWDEIAKTCTLTQDLNESVEIEEDGIILDCAGRSITGLGLSGYGIYANGVNNITIKNCTITNFDRGINFYNSNNNRIISNNISDTYRGMSLRYFNSSTVKSNIISNLKFHRF